ncbi:MAG TPA: serine hydrolase domain-containing protein [Chitinophaga sp.]
MNRLSIPLLLALFAPFIAIPLYGQPIPDSTLKKLDQLFARWNRPNSPGCAVGIIRNDSLIFSKGYGMANLEYDIPNTPATIYHMASVSKQFTAFSIVLLARQGRLKLDDDVRRYLPWFPDLKEKITIRHLLHHTSGIRDQWQLLATAGTRLDDVITQDQIIRILSRQRALNSKPGEKFNYCNSGYTMMAEIVKAVTGQTLRQFTDSAIFKPLGMQQTHFHDDYTEVVKNRSFSYYPKDSAHYSNSVLSYSNVGATSLFTNINDMSKWVMNFYTHKVGDQQDIDTLTKKGRLNNGREIDYALGISNMSYKGWKGFSHGGGDAGFRTIVTVFPDLKMGFIVFANVGNLNPGQRATEMAALFINDTTKGSALKKDNEKKDSSGVIQKNTAALGKFMGNYISDEGMQINFRLNNNKLYAEAYGQSELLREKKDTFSLFNNPDIKFSFKIRQAGDTTVSAVFNPDTREVLKKYNTAPLPVQTLKAYTGTYYSPELDCKYGIAIKNNGLVLTNSKYDDAPIILAGPDQMLIDRWWMGNLQVTRDTKGQITGFEVNSGRVLHLKFDKLKE